MTQLRTRSSRALARELLRLRVERELTIRDLAAISGVVDPWLRAEDAVGASVDRMLGHTSRLSGGAVQVGVIGPGSLAAATPAPAPSPAVGGRSSVVALEDKLDEQTGRLDRLAELLSQQIAATQNVGQEVGAGVDNRLKNNPNTRRAMAHGISRENYARARAGGI